MPSQTLPFDSDLALSVVAGLASGLLIGIERGWRQREQPSGMRVAGIRTFALIGGMGALSGIVAEVLSPIIAAILLAGLVAMLVASFVKEATGSKRRDATTMVAAMVALSLGLLAGAGYPAFAVAGAAVTTLVLALRRQLHGLIDRLSDEEVQAIARYAVLALAILPFLPDAQFGPYNAWNPFKLWLVVLLITGFSIAGYVANRLVGERKGTIATAVIGGAYSSTAVTAALSSRLGKDEAGPFSTGIALASAVMYLRVILLTVVIAPVVTLPLLKLLGPAAIAAFVAAALVWRSETIGSAEGHQLQKKPFELLPALGFLAAVAGASLLVNWAQTEFGETGGGLSLFIAGSFDVDAAIVAFSALPTGAISPRIAAIALAGTVGVNMAFKTAVVFANAKWKAGRTAVIALLSSLAVLLGTLGWAFVATFLT
ncbi:DUF4010 domain-containing protein [Croceicoccus ponticola]|uniref:DUF4010 domain-containing protein n=1 Tax=Croceicoccus ponticola TaxID=2217664 RepID=A0A437H162_9SPHN|nr:DUF4010 domain-containing protein [Croceicoccus ponticola]RVQ69365.1 DUF4010 domain-containing protein [Croceicoccus ponticola]